jgi:hypothetical protein
VVEGVAAGEIVVVDVVEDVVVTHAVGESVVAGLEEHGATTGSVTDLRMTRYLQVPPTTTKLVFSYAESPLSHAVVEVTFAFALMISA